MIRLKDGTSRATDEYMRDAITIAEYYGFAPFDALTHAPYDKEREKKLIEGFAKAEEDIVFARRDERTLPTVTRKFVTRTIPRDTTLAWRIVATTGTCPTTSFELHILGTANTIAEALLITAADAIARAAGIRERIVTINNIGSSESSARYARDVGQYLRKHIESISPSLRPRAATDPIGTLVQLIERGHPAVPRAPQAMEYLSEEERARFWELLEYLEAAGIPYELGNQVLGSRDCWSHALFELSQIDDETGLRMPIAFGGRYDPLISRFARSPRTATMISISYETSPTNKKVKSFTAERPHAVPLIYFAHLGPVARQRSLGILEMLRQADIRVHHGLWHDRMTEQMERAQSMGAPFLLIFGHKEATEGTVLLREVATNAQTAIPLNDLVSHLKKHRGIARKVVV